MKETVRAYDRDAVAYAARTATMPDSVRVDVEHLATRLGPGARVLEIGSGGGRDALLMEELGLVVRRTDVTPGFVALLRGQGHACDRLDPLATRSTKRWISRHSARGLPARGSLKEGDGEGWSTHGTISGPRHFTYWRAPDLEVVAAGSGWTDLEVRRGLEGDRGETWLELSAVRDGVSP